MRKILGVSLSLVLVIVVYYSLRSNPIILNVINELTFTPQGWVLELKAVGTMSTNDWFLISKDDTAQFKPFILSDITPYVFTQDSLLQPMLIHKTGDSLVITSVSQGRVGFLTFGNLTNASVLAPKTGQSICWGWDCYYLDNTSTLGLQNDSINANGRITFYVKDGQGSPLPDVKVSYQIYRFSVLDFPGWYNDTLITDSDGFCTIASLARLQSISLNKQNFVRQSFFTQVWPESTVTMNLTMAPVVSVEKRKDQGSPKTFSIGEPYPNPFNPETRIPYTLAQKGTVDIEVYDMTGKRVDNIFHGDLPTGSYIARWNAAQFPSGIYFVRLRTEASILSTRCALVK